MCVCVGGGGGGVGVFGGKGVFDLIKRLLRILFLMISSHTV